MAIGTVAEIGIRVFLDDASSGGLTKINQLMRGVGNAARGSSADVGAMMGKMAAIGALVGSIAAFAAFAAAIKYSIDAASEFQQAMFSVAVATHVPLDEAMKYSGVLMNLGATSTYTSAEIANGIVLLGRSGYGIRDIFTYMAQAGIALGIATRTSATDGFKLLAQTMAAFQAPASQAMHYADLLQFAFEHQTGSVSQLSSAFAAASPAAARLGVPLRELVAALDVVGPALGNTSLAGTALRYMMQSVTSPTNQAISALASLGIITVSATTPAMQKFTDSLLRTGAVSSSFVRANDTSVAGLKNLFAAAQAAGLVPLDAKFNEWAASSGVMQNAFFDAHGKAKDLTNIIQVLTQHMKGMNDEAKAAYLKDIFSVRGGQAAQVLLQQIQKYQEYLKQLATSQDNAGGAMRRWEEVMRTFQGAMSGLSTSIRDLGVVIGLAILPAVTNFVTGLNRIITAIRQAAMANPAATAGFLKLGAVISALAVVAAIVALAFMGIGIPIMIFVGVAVATIAVIVGLTVGITLLVNWIRNVTASATPLGAVFRAIGGIFRDIANFLMGQMTTAWNSVKGSMATLGPAFQMLGNALRPLLPVLLTLAGIIGAILVGAIHGIIGALSMFIQGLAMLIAGVVHVITGIITVVMGFFTVLHGIFTLNGNEIKQGFQMIWDGIQHIVFGVLQAIAGIIVGTFGTIIGFVAGFVHGIISFFQNLASVLVGHSIIPDMMHAILNVFTSVLSAIGSLVSGFVLRIINWFLQMGQRVVSTVTAAWNLVRSTISSAFNLIVSIIASAVLNIISHIISMGVQLVSRVQSAMSQARSAVSTGINNVVSFFAALPGRILGALGNLGGMLYNAGSNAIHQLASGIQGAIGSVVGAVSNVVGFISSHLPHSPAKMGPLRDLPMQSEMIGKQIAEGINRSTPNIGSALNRALGGISGAPAFSRAGAPMVAGGGGGGNTNITVPLVVDGRVLGQVVLGYINGQLQMNGLGRSFR